MGALKASPFETRKQPYLFPGLCCCFVVPLCCLFKCIICRAIFFSECMELVDIPSVFLEMVMLIQGQHYRLSAKYSKWPIANLADLVKLNLLQLNYSIFGTVAISIATAVSNQPNYFQVR